MPFPLPSIPVSLSPPQMHLRGRTVKQCLFLIMVPHRSPTNKYKSTRTSPTTDRSCLSTPFDSSVSNASQMHLLRRTIFGDFPNVSLHVSMVLLDWSTFLLDSSMVLLIFLWFYSIFPWFCSTFLGFCSIFPWLSFIPWFTQFSNGFARFFHGFSMVLLDFSIILPFHSGLPKYTSEDGPGGNRYPTVTQLPPGT